MSQKFMAVLRKNGKNLFRRPWVGQSNRVRMNEKEEAKIAVRKGLEFLLIELPPRYMPMMPNGIAHVHMALKKNRVKVQTIDFNIFLYHRFHTRREKEHQDKVTLSDGLTLHDDPWDQTCVSEFWREAVLEYFSPDFDELLEAVVEARPLAVGFSINGDNITAGLRFVKELRVRIPESVIVVGGYSCTHATMGPYLFPDYDYMVIGEAELSLPPLVTALKKGERPADLPGILSKWDSSCRSNIQSERPMDLDEVGWPNYDWVDLSLYKEMNGSTVVPICESRGCAWSKCRFCGECFPFRNRSAKSVADEIEYFYKRGFDTFHFNGSDVNGDPANLAAICNNVLSRGISAKFMGQLRIDKRNTREYFGVLGKAGFVHLRFGVDAWSMHTLRLQRKGYNVRLIKQNLKDCHDAGIYTTANILVGVPGETEADIDESIENLIACSDWIDMVESFNPLALIAGSEYYINPEKYGIKFRGDKDEIYASHRNAILGSLWYSEDPYIDENVRYLRIRRIIKALNESGVKVGEFAKKVIEEYPRRDNHSSTTRTAKKSVIADVPKAIRLIRDLGDYNLVEVNGAYMLVLKAMGPIELSQERIGDRELFPYVVRAQCGEEMFAKLRVQGEDPDDWEVVTNGESLIQGYNKKLFNTNPCSDFFASWELAPFVYTGRTEREALAALSEDRGL